MTADIIQPPCAPQQPPAVITRQLTERQERYARCVAAGMSFAEAFRTGGLKASTAGSQSRQIGDLNRNPLVVARIRELKIAADDDTVQALSERMAWLRLIISADPRELSRVVHNPCGNCWTDITLAEAITAHYAMHEFGERPALPDETRPNPRCKHCEGDGVQRVVLTPTDELSPAGRALFKGAEQNEKGVIKIYMQDQLAAADMLNKLQSLYVTKSLNMNVNASVHAARDSRPEDALRLFEAFDAP
jgi:hypothetical protein